MEMAVKAAAMEKRARWRRRGRPAAAVAHGGGRPAKGERRPLTPFLHNFLVLSLVDEGQWGGKFVAFGGCPKTRVSSLYIGGDNASRPSDGWPLDPMALGHL